MCRDEAILARMLNGPISMRARPRLYGDTLIQALLGVKNRLSTAAVRPPARFYPKSARSSLPDLAGAELHQALSPGKNA
ncbi:MAG: hypothetical protein E5299_01181 [Burkholderia gladioli]|nr:MAG: hypothetical protein E5299_01181 [Burkholderia gladioli]